MSEYIVLSLPEPAATESVGLGPTVLSEAESPAPVPQLERHNLTPIEAARIEQQPEVAAVARRMPIRLIEPFATAQGGSVQQAWGLDAIGALASEYTGKGATVAILDTGIDARHPAFAGVEIIQKDFTGEGDGDQHGHGTHCAGTILGRDVGGVRIGVARGVEKLLVGKVIGQQNADSTMLFDALDWAVQSKADVISMSLGFDFPGYVARRITIDRMPIEAAVSDGLEAYRSNLRMLDAILRMIAVGGAYERDPVVIAAAGNESQRPAYTVAASLPAAALDVVSVAALEAVAAGKFGVTSFSNTLPVLAAPGLDVLSAKAHTDTLVAMSGTSMACPHVAGVAALWWQALNKEGVEPNAVNILARLNATSRRGVIAAGSTATDVGLGMVTAP